MESETLVGRGRQLAELDRRLAVAAAGDGGVALVEGDAGAGKTALAHAVVRRARAAGMRTAWGACLEGEGAAPYRPWLQVLRALGESGSVLVDAGGSQSRFQQFDDVVALLRTSAADRSLLVVIDDLHWADVPSLRLLQSVAAAVPEDPILVLGLYRGREVARYPEWADALRATERERAVSRLTLGGLTLAQVAELAARVLPDPPGESLVDAVYQRSEGNPLFALELLRLAASGVAAGRLPESVSEVIGRRLDRLTPPVRALLRTASVLGREFTAGLLGALGGDGVTTEGLAAAVAEGLLVPDGHGWRFDHVLTQEVLYQELAGAERRRLHARAAEAVRPAGSLDALAHHLRQAVPSGDARE
ncbi:MAG: ATP-binding protein, partial [Micromonosporaceae bacterium]